MSGTKTYRTLRPIDCAKDALGDVLGGALRVGHQLGGGLLLDGSLESAGLAVSDAMHV